MSDVLGTVSLSRRKDGTPSRNFYEGQRFSSKSLIENDDVSDNVCESGMGVGVPAFYAAAPLNPPPVSFNEVSVVSVSSAVGAGGGRAPGGATRQRDLSKILIRVYVPPFTPFFPPFPPTRRAPPPLRNSIRAMTTQRTLLLILRVILPR